MVFTTRFSQGGLTSRNGFESELVRLRVRQKNSRPNHPATCGKVERFQQTMKRWLGARPRATTIIELQTQLDQFVDDYNHRRPHRSLAHHSTPVVMLVHDLDIRVIHAATGEIIRTLTLDSEHHYQPTDAKRGGPKRPYGPYGPYGPRKTKQPEP